MLGCVLRFNKDYQESNKNKVEISGEMGADKRSSWVCLLQQRHPKLSITEICIKIESFSERTESEGYRTTYAQSPPELQTPGVLFQESPSHVVVARVRLLLPSVRVDQPADTS